MLLRVVHILEVVFVWGGCFEADFISLISVDEIVKTSTHPISNENCKSKLSNFLLCSRFVSKDLQPQYYVGTTCENYWLCFNGLQYPELSCPEGTVFDTTFHGCVNAEYGRCPEDDLIGYLNEQLIFPEYQFHRTCSIRSIEGDYEFILNKELVYNPVLCEYRQICEDGRLNIKKCPLKFSWNNDEQTCIPEKNNTICHPNGHWSIQTGLDLTECIGTANGECRLGFTSFSRAQKYCENNIACVGIKEDKCNESQGIGIPCIGTRWRPFGKIIDSPDPNYKVWTIQNPLPGQIGQNDDLHEEFDFSYNWASEKELSYDGCPDGFYTKDNQCKTRFEEQQQAMAFCEKNVKCSGVANQENIFVPIESILMNGEAKISKNGPVIEKLNKIFQTYLDKRTEENMLVEYWEDSYEGELKGCTHVNEGICFPTFDNMFEAQYYCEELGEKCSGEISK